MADKMPALLATCTEAAGRPRERAQEFANKYEGYLMEPRYLGMFRSGRDAMASFLRDADLRACAAAGELDEEEEALLLMTRARPTSACSSKGRSSGGTPKRRGPRPPAP